MSLWSILAAPLLAGNDLRNVAPPILAILTNREVIASDQDKNGKQGTRRWKSGQQEIWVRDLAGCDRAVAVFNRATGPDSLPQKWAPLEVTHPQHAASSRAHQCHTLR